MQNQIAKMLNIPTSTSQFQLNGFDFEYHAKGKNTHETLYTYWNGGSRSFTIHSGIQNPERELQMFVNHAFTSKQRREFV